MQAKVERIYVDLDVGTWDNLGPKNGPKPRAPSPISQTGELGMATKKGSRRAGRSTKRDTEKQEAYDIATALLAQICTLPQTDIERCSED